VKAADSTSRPDSRDRPRLLRAALQARLGYARLADANASEELRGPTTMLGTADLGTNQSATTAVDPPRCECGGKGGMRGWDGTERGVEKGFRVFTIVGRLMD